GSKKVYIAAQPGEILLQLRVEAAGRSLVVVEGIDGDGVADRGNPGGARQRRLPDRQGRHGGQGCGIEGDSLVVDRVAPLYPELLGDRCSDLQGRAIGFAAVGSGGGGEALPGEDVDPRRNPGAHGVGLGRGEVDAPAKLTVAHGGPEILAGAHEVMLADLDL